MTAAAAVHVRRMGQQDIDRVMAIAAGLKDAPHWKREAYEAAVDAGAMPRRLALVAEVIADLKGHGLSRAVSQAEEPPALATEGTLAAKSPFPLGLKPPFASSGTTAQLKPRPFKAAPLNLPQEAGDGPERGRVAGFAIASVVAPQAELESIAVAPAGQGQGIGRALLTALAEELRTLGVVEFLLEVRASNQSALGFYRKLGWVETGRRPRYYAEPEEDAVLMSFELG